VVRCLCIGLLWLVFWRSGQKRVNIMDGSVDLCHHMAFIMMWRMCLSYTALIIDAASWLPLVDVQ